MPKKQAESVEKFHFQMLKKKLRKWKQNFSRFVSSVKFQTDKLCLYTQIESFALKITHKIIEFPSTIAKKEGEREMGRELESRKDSKPQNFNFITVKLMMKFRFDLFIKKEGSRVKIHERNLFKSIINTKAL